MSHTTHPPHVLIAKAVMSLRGINQKELAEKVGHTPGFISDRMTGRKKWDVDDISMFAEALDVPAGTFFRDPGDAIEELTSLRYDEPAGQALILTSV